MQYLLQWQELLIMRRWGVQITQDFSDSACAPLRWLRIPWVCFEKSSRQVSAASLDKEVPIYACPTDGDWYHVRLLDLYVQKLPPEAIENDISQTLGQDSNVPCYTSVSVGQNNNTLDKVNVMCINVGLEGHETNQSKSYQSHRNVLRKCSR